MPIETDNALTYQPFAAIPKLDELRDELFHNVAQHERLLSLAGGAAVLLAGLRHRSFLGVILALAGSAFVVRGASGHCPLYTALGKNTHSTPQSV